jgi:hypothetical protein
MNTNTATIPRVIIMNPTPINLPALISPLVTIDTHKDFPSEAKMGGTS